MLVVLFGTASVLDAQEISYSDVSFKDEVIFERHESLKKDVIRFSITIYNTSDRKIPDLGVTSRSEYLRLFVNEEDHSPLSLYNGLETADSDHMIEPGDSSSYSVFWPLDIFEQSGYGKSFTVFWKYAGLETNGHYVRMVDQRKFNLIAYREYNHVMSFADSYFNKKRYDSALEMYRRANRMIPGEKYVEQQIKLCKELVQD